ncbi:hypothetical protein [Paraflavitalea sp. CAU 1676]|uniref:hypothetical protein n=1 Tax=Paraflavitalea sp. CAU 1676 TaxID=3032598 RepID=UPI0023DA7467|nr:hypothetical protein [Paraflavitalea sp. CAU 1676]MDF2192692.1 hypothetical protein [Paraflavitalea sp. CAU 1676]
MTNPVFISLSVKNLNRSRVFFRRPAFGSNRSSPDLEGPQWELVYLDADQLPIQ